MKGNKVRVVLDTNVVLAYTWTKSEDSPNKEIIRRWEKSQFDVYGAEMSLMNTLTK